MIQCFLFLERIVIYMPPCNGQLLKRNVFQAYAIDFWPKLPMKFSNKRGGSLFENGNVLKCRCPLCEC